MLTAREGGPARPASRSRFPVALAWLCLFGACDDAAVAAVGPASAGDAQGAGADGLLQAGDAGPQADGVVGPGDVLADAADLGALPDDGAPAEVHSDGDLAADAPPETSDTTAEIDTACAPICGDATCDLGCGEDPGTCAKDCPAVCGDALCTPGENPVACPADCCGSCGDGVCKGYGCGENVPTLANFCAADCVQPCGDGTCAKGENPANCAADCANPGCGNGLCEVGESGDCGPDKAPGPNQKCCPQDCGTACGNCVCEKGESSDLCPVDCGFCGDGVCSPCGVGLGAESTATCAADCAFQQCNPAFTAQNVCADDSACTQDLCDDKGTCIHLPLAATCSDDNACSDGDACQDGKCQAGATPHDCSDGNPCTQDWCDPGAGCAHPAVSAGTPCDDQEACTVGDACAGGSCAGTAKPCDDTNPCTTDGCAKGAGCVFLPFAATPCNDGDACTVGETCQGGACQGGQAPDCDDQNPCTQDACQKGQGCSHPAQDGAACTDGNICTDKDKCAGASCVGTLVACNDNEVCTKDACHPQLGCQAPPDDGQACDDGSACTAASACLGGKCLGSQVISCDDANPCTADACHPLLGCQHVNTTVPCNDGNPCTSLDTCVSGQCAPPGSPATDCSDQNPCTDDGCDPKTGCLHTPNSLACETTVACGVCAAGTCTALPGAKPWKILPDKVAPRFVVAGPSALYAGGQGATRRPWVGAYGLDGQAKWATEVLNPATQGQVVGLAADASVVYGVTMRLEPGGPLSSSDVFALGSGGAVVASAVQPAFTWLSAVAVRPGGIAAAGEVWADAGAGAKSLVFFEKNAALATVASQAFHVAAAGVYPKVHALRPASAGGWWAVGTSGSGAGSALVWRLAAGGQAAAQTAVVLGESGAAVMVMDVADLGATGALAVGAVAGLGPMPAPLAARLDAAGKLKWVRTFGSWLDGGWVRVQPLADAQGVVVLSAGYLAGQMSLLAPLLVGLSSDGAVTWHGPPLGSIGLPPTDLLRLADGDFVTAAALLAAKPGDTAKGALQRQTAWGASSCDASGACAAPPGALCAASSACQPATCGGATCATAALPDGTPCGASASCGKGVCQ